MLNPEGSTQDAKQVSQLTPLGPPAANRRCELVALQETMLALSRGHPGNEPTSQLKWWLLLIAAGMPTKRASAGRAFRITVRYGKR